MGIFDIGQAVRNWGPQPANAASVSRAPTPNSYALDDPAWSNSMAGGSPIPAANRVSSPLEIPPAAVSNVPVQPVAPPAPVQLPPLSRGGIDPLAGIELKRDINLGPQPEPWSPGQFMQRGEGFDIYDVPAIGPALGGLYEGITALPEQLGLGALARSPLGQSLKDFGEGAIEGYNRYKGIGQQPRDFAAMIRGMSAEERAELLGLLQGP